MSLEIESQDVIRIVLQFLKENNLVDSMSTLQKESGVTLNTVDNIETFTADIRHGKWDSVLAQTAMLKLPSDKLVALYEQVVLELLETGERDLAKGILRAADPLISLQTSHPERYMRLEQFIKRPFFNASDAYEMGSSKELRRHEIAEALSCEVSVVQPSRLLSLLGQSLKFQHSQGLIPPGVPFDLFRGTRKAAKRDAEERVPKKLATTMSLTELATKGDDHSVSVMSSDRIDSLSFSPDGQHFVTGSGAGKIVVWDVDTFKLRVDLDYQAEGQFMVQDDGCAVLCVVFSRDGDHIATGSQDGQIKIWKLSTGACLRKFAHAHPQGVTSLAFFRDGTQILSASFDQTARIHGLKSGKTLKEFRGHTSFVNCALYTKDSSNTILTSSSDGTLKLWDIRSTECLLTYRPGVQAGVSVTREIAVHTIQLVPNTPDLVFVCTNSPQAFIMTTHGQVVRSFSSGKQCGGDFVCATISPQGKWLYCVGEDGVMYIFDAKSGQLENVLPLSGDSLNPVAVLSVVHHPHRNVMVTNASGSEVVSVWGP